MILVRIGPRISLGDLDNGAAPILPVGDGGGGQRFIDHEQRPLALVELDAELFALVPAENAQIEHYHAA